MFQYLHSPICCLLTLLSMPMTQHAQNVRPVTPEPDVFQCEEITAIELCTNIYSHASFPNFRGHPNQVMANEELLNFTPLIEIACSDAIVHFLCSIYAPFCQPGVNIRIAPCRELCTQVRSTCEPFLVQQDLIWPEHLACENFRPDNETFLDFCPQNVSFPENVTTITPTIRNTTPTTITRTPTTRTTTASVPETPDILSAACLNSSPQFFTLSASMGTLLFFLST